MRGAMVMITLTQCTGECTGRFDGDGTVFCRLRYDCSHEPGAGYRIHRGADGRACARRDAGGAGDGRALPAGELAFIGNVAPQTASFHLRKLMDASLITVERQGKHNYYRLANERVAGALESLATLAPERDQVASTRIQA